MMVTLYKMDSRGETRVWQIEDRQMGFVVRYGQLHGTETVKHHEVYDGKSGRTVGEQIELEMKSRIKKKVDMGYSDNIEDAKVKATNSMGLLKPMLAANMTNTALPSHYYLQRKYDGNRCIVTKQEGKVICYSRSGQEFTIPHIASAASALPEGMSLDGELYDHGTPLQTLRSWIARKQPETANIKFICYDLISSETYSKRYSELLQLPLSYPIIRAGTDYIDAEKAQEINIKARLDRVIADGYEGLIARSDDSGYEDGKRSKSLIKIKRWLDSEFIIVDVTTSADGWGVLICRTDSGRTFKVSAPGTIDEKVETYILRKAIIGRQVTVQYANLTKDGIPFHPVATVIN